MKLKTTKEQKATGGRKQIPFIKRLKTVLGIVAGYFIIILVVSVCVINNTPAKKSGSQSAYYASETKTDPVQSKPQTGSESKTSVTETDNEPLKSNLEADTWYVYKPLDLLKFQNCVIYDATAVGSKSIVVQYFSVCKKCHVIEQNGEGLPQAAAPGLNYPIKKMYHCGKCGETTVVRLEIIQ